MNYSDLRFVLLVLGVGTGLGAALARRHGLVGFVGGFALVAVVLFALLTVVRWCSKRTKKDSSGDEHADGPCE